MGYSGKVSEIGRCKTWETGNYEIQKTNKYKIWETNMFGKSNTIETSNYGMSQTGNCNKAACLIKNDGKSRHTIYGLLLSDSEQISYFW